MKYILKISLFIIIALFFANNLKAQIDLEAKEIINQRIEELSAKTDMEFDFSELYDHFADLYEHPIAINSATEEELQQLMFLNNNQIIILMEARDKNGGFQTIYELKDLDGFYVSMVQSIQPFISFDIAPKEEKLNFNKLLTRGKNQVIIRYGQVLEEQAGYMPISDEEIAEYPNRRYLGSKDKLYMRYRYQYRNKISFGVLGDKDAGEEFFKGSNKNGFDFYSAHFFLRDQGRVKALAIGDYHLEFGQGLTMWSGMAFGKSATSINLQRQARGLRANTSANEVLFFRGVATTIELSKNIDVTAFYSNKGLDAGLSAIDTADSDELVFSSIQESGMHRTPSELAKKSAVNEQVMGANAQFKSKGFTIGITSYKTIYDTELIKDTKPYQVYDFQGSENINSGINASYANRYLSVFGEAAMSANKGKAFIIGSLFNLHPRLTFTILYRNYAKDYQNNYAVAVSEGGSAQNEEGIYFGSQIHLGAKNDFVVYYDLFKFPWLKYRVNAPSYGSEFSGQFMRQENRKLSYYVRFKYEEKMLNNSSDDDALLDVATLYKSNLRFHLAYKVSSRIKLQSRVAFSRYEHQPEIASSGYLVYQDVQFSPKRLPSVKFSLRYAIFNTDDYDTRIYAYENNVLYKFSVPAYLYQGQKYYVLMNYTLNRKISFWLHFAQTYYTKRTEIGSGLEEIDGNTKSEVTLQLRLKF